MHYLLAILITILIPRTALCAEQEIHWYHANFPPSIIEKGPLKGKGYGELFEKGLQSELPDYIHTTYTANYTRVLRQLKTSNGCCIELLKTPERENFIEYSTPVMALMPLGICIIEKRLSEFAPFIDESGAISLAKLLEKSDLKLGISTGRSYSAPLDKIIKQKLNSTKVVTQSQTEIVQRPLTLMLAQRGVDYVLEYPHILTWMKTKHNIQHKLKCIPVKEVAKRLLTYVGCSKNDWGKKAISKINHIIKNNYLEQYKQGYQKYLSPEEAKAHNKLLGE